MPYGAPLGPSGPAPAARMLRPLLLLLLQHRGAGGDFGASPSSAALRTAAAADDAAEDHEEEEDADADGDADDEGLVILDPGADFLQGGGADALALVERDAMSAT